MTMTVLLDFFKHLVDVTVAARVGHAYAEYAVHADCANMREYADADEKSHPHYPHKNICQKLQLFGPK